MVIFTKQSLPFYPELSTTNLLTLQLIFDAKRDEIINIFSQGSPQEKTKAVNIMREVDPSNASKYEKILAPK